MQLSTSCGGGGGGGSKDNSGSGENITPTALTASITSPSGDIAINEGNNVDFQASVSGGVPPYEYSWSFYVSRDGYLRDFDGPHGIDSTVQNPGPTTFNYFGCWPVILRVRDQLGSTATATVMVTVNKPGWTVLLTDITDKNSYLTFYSIKVDSSNIYWIDYVETHNPSDDPPFNNQYTIKKMGKNGGTVSNIASGNNIELNPGIAIDSTSIYWIECDPDSKIQTVKKVGISNGTVTDLCSLSYFKYTSSKIFVDATDVYFEHDEKLCKVGINGGTITELVSEQGFAVNDSEIYFVWLTLGGQTIRKVGKNGGDITDLHVNVDSGMSYFPMALDSTGIYWVESDPNYSTSCAIKKVGLNGGPPTILANNIYVPQMSVDPEALYFSSATQSLYKVGLEGGEVASIFEYTDYTYTWIPDFATDQNTIYFWTIGGGLWANGCLVKLSK